MFCKNCGIELEAGMAFCPECGTKAEAEVVCEVEEVPAQETTEAAPEVLQEIPCEEETCVCADVSAVPSEEVCAEVDPEVCAEDVQEVSAETVPEVSAEPAQELCAESEPADVQQETAEYSVDPQETNTYGAEETLTPAKKSNKLLVCIVAAVVMVALVVAGVFVVPKFFGGNYEDVAKNYGIAYAEADLVKASEYCLCSYVDAYNKMVDYSCEEYEMTREEFFELLSEQSGDKVESVEQLFVIMKEEAVTYLQEEYGTYTITAKVAGTEEMSAVSVEELREYISEDQGYDYPSMFEGVDADKISEGYIVELEVTINGSKSTDTETQEVTVVKYNGKWKAIGE